MHGGIVNSGCGHIDILGERLVSTCLVAALLRRATLAFPFFKLPQLSFPLRSHFENCRDFHNSARRTGQKNGSGGQAAFAVTVLF
jgi:hypothetical protein